jgi:hypothetical protein
VDNHVVILGAGFSRSISQYMPLTDELGDLAIAFADLTSDPRIPKGGFGPGFSFESWLSLLAEDQPHLTEAENAANAWLFARLREALFSVLSSAESSVIHYPAPEWLYDLLSLLHYEHCTVVSLNYDSLVEVGVASHHLAAELTNGRVSPRDILWDLPPLPDIGGRFYAPLNPTFRLLKLHGSLDWWWVPGDASGTTLNRSPLESAFGDPKTMRDTIRRQQLPGRVPFIIPPTATKSSYYRTPLTRELWQTARQALQATDHVSILGYSLPPGDLVMSGMLESAIRGKGISIEIADLDPAGPKDRLVGLGAAPESITTFAGPESIRELINHWLDSAAENLGTTLKSARLGTHATAALLVAWANPIGQDLGAHRISRVAKLVPSGPDGDYVELLLAKDDPIGGATAIRVGPDGAPTNDVWPNAGDLVAALQKHRKIKVRNDEGRLRNVIATSYEAREIGANPYWLALVPAGRQPERPTA